MMCFEEISEATYRWQLESVPPERWSSPYENFGWFLCGEIYRHDSDGSAWYHLCFQYNGRFFRGQSKSDTLMADIEYRISAFCRKLDEQQISNARFVYPARQGLYQVEQENQSNAKFKENNYGR